MLTSNLSLWINDVWLSVTPPQIFDNFLEDPLCFHRIGTSPDLLQKRIARGGVGLSSHLFIHTPSSLPPLISKIITQDVPYLVGHGGLEWNGDHSRHQL
jgi:hypothetical protein